MFTLITAKMIQFDNLTIIFSNGLLPPPTRILCWRWISKKNVFGIWTKIEEPKKIWTILKSLSQLPTLTFVFGKYIGGIFGSTRTVKLTTSLVLKMDGWKMIHVLVEKRTFSGDMRVDFQGRLNITNSSKDDPPNSHKTQLLEHPSNFQKYRYMVDDLWLW